MPPFHTLKYGQKFLISPGAILRSIYLVAPDRVTIIRHDDTGPWYLVITPESQLWNAEVEIV